MLMRPLIMPVNAAEHASCVPSKRETLLSQKEQTQLVSACLSLAHMEPQCTEGFDPTGLGWPLKPIEKY